MTNPDKAFFVTAYFEQATLRIERLAKLHSEKLGEVSFKDEAFTLCLVYIDGLASCFYGEANSKTFCKALRELSGNPLFGKLHAQVFLDPDNAKYWRSAIDVKQEVEDLMNKRSGELFDESEVAAIIRKSSMSQWKQEELIGNLWRCSIGGGWPTHQIRQYSGCPIHAVPSHEWAIAQGAIRFIPRPVSVRIRHVS